MNSDESKRSHPKTMKCFEFDIWLRAICWAAQVGHKPFVLNIWNLQKNAFHIIDRRGNTFASVKHQDEIFGLYSISRFITMTS